MLSWIHRHPEHFLFLALLVSRLGDVISTRLATPQLKLEANPIVRRLGWKFAAATLLISFFPYYDWKASLMLLVPSLLVTASNAGKIWMVRTMGEDEYVHMMMRLAGRSRMRSAIAPALAAAAFTALAGLVLVCFNPDPGEPAYWFAQGIIVYAVVIALYGTLAFFRLFRAVHRQ